jgi:hypothetical protein
MIGRSVAHFRITGKLGQGGMPRHAELSERTLAEIRGCT